MHRSRSVSPLFALVAVALLGFATTFTTQAQSGSTASAAAQSNKVTTKVISPAEQQAALKLMTREVIAAARPMNMPTRRGPATIDAPAQDRQEVTGAPGRTAGGAAAPNADRVARAAYPRDWAIMERSNGPVEEPTTERPADEPATDQRPIETNGTSQVYSSYIVNSASAVQTMYPHRMIGKLTYTLPNGQASYCSATSISGNVVLTAAHCIHESTSNTWYSNFVFAPAYRNGSAPYGTFAATNCYVLNSWINLSGRYNLNTWAQHDVAVCKMGLNSAGTTLNNAVGYLGRQWNQSYTRHVHNLGYPLRDVYETILSGGAQYLRTCVGESFYQSTEIRGVGCNFGGGISGGPWVVGYALNVAGGVIEGVNSGKFDNVQNMYGARFNSNNIVELCNIATC